MGLDGEPDLVEFDPVAAQLDLPVHPAGEPVAAVGLHDQVAGAVEHGVRRVGGERVGQEALGGQVGAVQVAAGHLDAADVQFAGGAGGDRRQLLVEQVEGGAVDGAADRHS